MFGESQGTNFFMSPESVDRKEVGRDFTWVLSSGKKLRECDGYILLLQDIDHGLVNPFSKKTANPAL